MPKRKILSIVSDADRAELERHYRFLTDNEDHDEDAAGNSSSGSSTWQDRMVRHYHRHLYKDCVLADLSRVSTHRALGLRWRTQAEVLSGKGRTSCGNKHCPSHRGTNSPRTTGAADSRGISDRGSEQEAVRRYLSNDPPKTEKEEVGLLQSLLPHGALQADFEVPFRHVEHGETRTELVSLRLCARCAPLLMELSHPSAAAVAARRARSAAAASRPEESVSSPQPKRREAKESPPKTRSLPRDAADESESNASSSSASQSSRLNEVSTSSSQRRRCRSHRAAGGSRIDHGPALKSKSGTNRQEES